MKFRSEIYLKVHKNWYLPDIHVTQEDKEQCQVSTAQILTKVNISKWSAPDLPPKAVLVPHPQLHGSWVFKLTEKGQTHTDTSTHKAVINAADQ